MNNRDTQLRMDVMRRVRVIHALHVAADSATVKGIIFVICCCLAAFLVSIPHVIQNMSHLGGITQDTKFLGFAFIHTTFKVEVILVLAIISCAWFVRDTVRNVRKGKLVVV